MAKTMNQDNYLDESLTNEQIHELNKQCIYAVNMPLIKNDLAKFRCKLCNYFSNNYDVAIKHCRSPLHNVHFKIWKHDVKMREQQVPPDIILNRFSNFLIDFYESNCIKQDQLDECYEFLHGLKLSFLYENPEAKFNVYGSVVTGICNTDPLIDIDIQIDKLNVNETLNLFYEFLIKNKSKQFELVFDRNTENLKSNTNIDHLIINNRLIINLFYLKLNKIYKLCLTSGIYHHEPNRVSKIILFYTKLDERVKILAFCLRYLAKISQIDKVDLNMLAPHVFSIMTIYFLQSIKPSVLPVLHELYQQQEKLENVDDIIYNENFESYLKNYVNNSKWRSDNNDSVGLLWLKMLIYYSYDYVFKDSYLSVRTQNKLIKSDFKIHGKKLAIEDPASNKQNLCRTLLTQTNDHFFEIMRKACSYFVRRLNEETNKEKLNEKEKSNRIKLVDVLIFQSNLRLRDYSNSDNEYEIIDASEVNSELQEKRTISECSNVTTKGEEEETYTDECLDDDEDDDDCKENGCFQKHVISDSNLINYDLIKELIEKMNIDITRTFESLYSYKPNVCLDKGYLKSIGFNKHAKLSVSFEAKSIGCEKLPPLVCTICNKEGHLNKDCPKDCLPELEKLPKLTDKWNDVLSQLCMKVMEKSKQNNEDEVQRNSLLDILLCIIRRKYPNAELRLFGSSNNGFCMKKSDLDICMTFKNYSLCEEKTIDIKKVIKDIGILLRNEADFYNIEARMAAKVPIVKFCHRGTQLEGDISVYNTLALHNTELLKSYTKIDKRLIVLGNVIKMFAKVCRIGDASCGSLSSYAYIIMMIHYLMRTEPPVLPCLQKIESETYGQNNHKIDGWDCWFYQDLDNLQTVWSGHNKNQFSIGELWLGFLRYYTEIFDWKTNVVSIRDTNLLTRKSKNWTKSRLAIEDPFELSHNLAAGVSHRMGLYILNAFIRARSVFGKVNNSVDENNVKIDRFFNSKILVDSLPPLDRNCFICAKIGHTTKECPNADAINKRRALKRLKNLNLNEKQCDLICYKCGIEGHLARDCLKEKEVQQQRCFKCSKFGHISKECHTFVNNKNCNDNSLIKQQLKPELEHFDARQVSNSGVIPNAQLYYTDANIHCNYYTNQYMSQQQISVHPDFYFTHSGPLPLTVLNTSFQYQYNQYYCQNSMNPNHYKIPNQQYFNTNSAQNQQQWFNGQNYYQQPSQHEQGNQYRN